MKVYSVDFLSLTLTLLLFMFIVYDFTVQIQIGAEVTGLSQPMKSQGISGL